MKLDKIFQKLFPYILFATVVLLVGYLLKQRLEGFQSSATGPQMLCAIEYGKNNPTTVTDRRLKTYITNFNLTEAKQKQNLGTDANYVLRQIRNDGMTGPLNTYYGRIRTQRAVLSCLQQTYATPNTANPLGR